MKNLFYLILIVLGLAACDKPFNEKPDNLLSKSEMVDVLADLYLYQQMVNGAPAKDGNYIAALAESTLFIFEKHGVNRQDFEKSYRYYYTTPKDFQKILDKVKIKLTDQLSEEEKQRQVEIQVE